MEAMPRVSAHSGAVFKISGESFAVVEGESSALKARRRSRLQGGPKELKMSARLAAVQGSSRACSTHRCCRCEESYESVFFESVTQQH